MAVKISELANLISWNDAVYIPVVETDGAFSTVKTTSAEMKSYVLGNVLTDITTLNANANAQATSIYTVSVSVNNANLGMKGYVDNTVSTANIGLKGYVDFANTVQSGAITQANVGMKGYVDRANTIQSSQITTVSNSVTAANVGLKGYVDFGNTIQAGAITQANVGMKGYVDSQTTYSNVNVTTYLPTHTGLVQASGIINAGSDGTGNIGNSSVGFNTVHARATTAAYADVAENYLADAVYEPGTVLAFGGTQEVTVASAETSRIAGIVTTTPAHLMNSALVGEYVVGIALLGRTPCKVKGPVAKGDSMISAGDGFAKSAQSSPSIPHFGSIIGKAVSDHSDGEGLIEVVVGRL